MDRRTRTDRQRPTPLIAATAALSVAGALLAGSGAALAAGSPGSGGAGLAGGAGSSNPLVHPANQPVASSGDGLTLATVASGQTRRALAFTGTAPAADVGQTVELERATGAGPDASWVVVASAHVATGGAFTTDWRATEGGRFEIEAVLAGSAASGVTGTSSGGGTSVAGSSVTASSDATSTATTPGTPAPVGGPATAPLTVSIYQSGVATLYGPGLYGRQTACGQTLRRRTLGVASRTLRCGTKVSVLFRGRTIDVAVIDRGPYANGADWDLTMATARALGIRTTTTIGALQLADR